MDNRLFLEYFLGITKAHETRKRTLSHAVQHNRINESSGNASALMILLYVIVKMLVIAAVKQTIFTIYIPTNDSKPIMHQTPTFLLLRSWLMMPRCIHSGYLQDFILHMHNKSHTILKGDPFWSPNIIFDYCFICSFIVFIRDSHDLHIQSI